MKNRKHVKDQSWFLAFFWGGREVMFQLLCTDSHVVACTEPRSRKGSLKYMLLLYKNKTWNNVLRALQMGSDKVFTALSRSPFPLRSWPRRTFPPRRADPGSRGPCTSRPSEGGKEWWRGLGTSLVFILLFMTNNNENYQKRIIAGSPALNYSLFLGRWKNVKENQDMGPFTDLRRLF